MTGIPSWVKVGARCVCIEAPWLKAGRNGPAEGDICNVNGGDEDPEGVWIVIEGHEETRNGTMVIRHAYHVTCFRPLVIRTQKQDIAEHFGHHLHQKLPERA